MEAGIASTILFVYPIMVAVIMALVFKEKISLQTALCMALALGGIALLYKGPDGATLSLIGTVLALASALTYAIYIVGINQTTLKNTATLTVTFYVLVFGVSLFIIRLLTGVELTTPSHWYMWANILALSIFPTAISFLCTTSAIQYIGSTPTAILGALEPVTAIFFGITVFGERMTAREGLGIVMILIAVIPAAADRNKTNPPTAYETPCRSYFTLHCRPYTDRIRIMPRRHFPFSTGLCSHRTYLSRLLRKFYHTD